MIDTLDAPNEDLEPADEGDADDELFLGATEHIHQNVARQMTSEQVWTPDGEIGVSSKGLWADYQELSDATYVRRPRRPRDARRQ